MKSLVFISIILILSSCCSPHFVGYVNPLYLEPDGYEETCPLQPCKPGQACPGKGIPWLNLEYEYADQSYLKIGPSYLGYSEKFMASFSGNYLTNLQINNTQTKQNGLGYQMQIGLLPKKNYYTTFLGFEQNHFLGKEKHNQYQPSIAFAPPIKILNAFQFKTGYQFNASNHKNYWTIGINLKAPIYPLLKLL